MIFDNKTILFISNNVWSPFVPKRFLTKELRQAIDQQFEIIPQLTKSSLNMNHIV